MAEEPRIFFRSAIFGLVVAALYWWATREIAGTILLGAFGMTGVLLTSVLVRAWRSGGGRLQWHPRRLIGLETVEGVHRVVPEVTRFPSAGLAPLLGGIGLSLAGLSLAWGPAFIIVALPLLLLAAYSWYQAAVREYPGSAQPQGSGQQQGSGQPRAAEPASRPVTIDSTAGPGASPAAPARLTGPGETAGQEQAVRSGADVTAAAAIVAVVLAIPLLGAALQRIPWIGARATRGKG